MSKTRERIGVMLALIQDAADALLDSERFAKAILTGTLIGVGMLVGIQLAITNVC